MINEEQGKKKTRKEEGGLREKGKLEQGDKPVGSFCVLVFFVVVSLQKFCVEVVAAGRVPLPVTRCVLRECIKLLCADALARLACVGLERACCLL